MNEYPRLSRGWRFHRDGRGWQAAHVTFGVTQSWQRRLSAAWAALLLELAYNRRRKDEE